METGRIVIQKETEALQVLGVYVLVQLLHLVLVVAIIIAAIVVDKLFWLMKRPRKKKRTSKNKND